MKPICCGIFLLGAALIENAPAGAWVASAHAKIAEAAVEALPVSMPPFFRAGAARIGKSAVDPDFFRLRKLPQLRNAEAPEHYLDSELLSGADWPARRYDYLELLAQLDRDAHAVGTLPYAIAEGVQLLAAGFAQVRLSPDDPWARAKVLHYAGIMAHYSADLCQPLHTTIHFNGRARADGSSPGSGIHLKTDSLADAVFSESPQEPLGAKTEEGIESPRDLWSTIRSEFAASHALVDRVYELESGLGPEVVSPEAMTFARERVTASIRFTSSLFVMAWELSGDLRVPDWFRRLQLESAEPAEPAAVSSSVPSTARASGADSPR